MDVCICKTIQQLAVNFDEETVQEITPAINQHLKCLWTVLSKSKVFTRDLQYHITPINYRTAKFLSVRSIDTSNINRLFESFKNNTDAFWQASNDSLHGEICRRIACISIYLRSKLDPEALIPAHLARFIEGQNFAELRYAGRKYLKIGRKLGGIGAIFWLPTDIPPSTYVVLSKDTV